MTTLFRVLLALLLPLVSLGVAPQASALDHYRRTGEPLPAHVPPGPVYTPDIPNTSAGTVPSPFLFLPSPGATRPPPRPHHAWPPTETYTA